MNVASLSFIFFKTMFEQNFKEKENRSVELKGKKYEDVLEFLQCLHPNLPNDVNKDNVFLIAPIAEEYQAKVMVSKCQHVMLEWLKSELASARDNNQRADRASTCLNILTEANSLQYHEIVQEAIKVIAHFGHAIFTGNAQLLENAQMFYGGCLYDPHNKDPIASCKNLFDNLPQELKYQLLQERLRLHDNQDMHVEAENCNQRPVVGIMTVPIRHGG